MMFTDREIFLFVICTVFYITLFIVVIQSNHRKIQLLQSRLDNIHAMQKMAVIEHRANDVNSIFASTVYQRIKQYLVTGQSMNEEDWAELTEVVNGVSSTRSRLYQKVFGKKGSTKDWDDFILSI